MARSPRVSLGYIDLESMRSIRSAPHVIQVMIKMTWLFNILPGNPYMSQVLNAQCYLQVHWLDFFLLQIKALNLNLFRPHSQQMLFFQEKFLAAGLWSNHYPCLYRYQMLPQLSHGQYSLFLHEVLTALVLR